ncbi:MAG: peptide deformylase [Proteobacteria bacterium]|nr:peptide deformylase [Pseudomonadota bacterium]
MRVGSHNVLQIGDPRLRQRSEDVSANDSEQKKDMARLQRTLSEFRRVKGFGRAIAAPQIGIARRFIAFDLGRLPFVMVNPVITWRSEATFTLWDDCMSFPSLLVKVRRHMSISVAYLDGEGNRQTWLDLEPNEAELVQHEIDHLDGILAVDRAQCISDIISRDAYAAMPEYFDALVDENPNAGENADSTSQP